MQINAKAKHVRMSPRKVRLVADAVRGKEAENAISQLKFINKLAAKPVAKLINSAMASAEHDFEIEKDNLKIAEIKVDEGPTLKRWTPRAHGRATPIRKRTSHISLVLAEIKESGKKEAKKQKIDAPVKLGSKPKEEGEAKVLSDAKAMAGKEEISTEEKDTKIIDPRGEGRGGHTKIEGKSHKGFMEKMFRRKSG